MNSVNLIGRVCNDIELRYTAGTQMAVCNILLAVKRPGKEETDFPKIVVYDKAAENCEKYLKKGRLCGVEGRLQTGSYEKNGIKIHTTEIVAHRVEFLEWGEKKAAEVYEDAAPSGFSAITEEIPF